MVADALIQSLRHAWLQLERLRLPMAIAGGLAMATWKHFRATRDVDLLVSIASDQVAQLLEDLRRAGLRPRREPPVASLGPLDAIQLLYEPPEAFLDIHVDLLLAKTEHQRQALGRRVATYLPGLDLPVAVLACEDLILLKLAAGRIIDRVDAVALLSLNHASLDRPYLVRWAEATGTLDALQSAWHEALPGSTPSLEGDDSSPLS